MLVWEVIEFYFIAGSTDVIKFCNTKVQRIKTDITSLKYPNSVLFF